MGRILVKCIMVQVHRQRTIPHRLMIWWWNKQNGRNKNAERIAFLHLSFFSSHLSLPLTHVYLREDHRVSLPYPPSLATSRSAREAVWLKDLKSTGGREEREGLGSLYWVYCTLSDPVDSRSKMPGSDDMLDGLVWSFMFTRLLLNEKTSSCSRAHQRADNFTTSED